MFHRDADSGALVNGDDGQYSTIVKERERVKRINRMESEIQRLSLELENTNKILEEISGVLKWQKRLLM